MTEALRSSVPLHHQIAQVLRTRLELGRWAESGAPATEQALCEEFGVSRTTVRLALSQLKTDGLLESRRGVGTRGVATPLKRHVVGSSGDPLHASLGTRSRIVTIGEIASPSAVAQFFGLAPNAPVWHFVRVHSLDQRPLSVVNSYLPLHLGQVFTRSSLKESMHDLLWKHFRLRQSRSIHTIRVARADLGISGLLGVSLADPVLAVQASIYLPDGRPVRWVENAFREDRYEYVAEMDWPAPSVGADAAPQADSLRPGRKTARLHR